MCISGIQDDDAVRLCLVLGFTENLYRCKCGMQSDTGMRQVRYWMTKCPKPHRVITHNKMQDVVAAIYRALHVHVTIEVRGLYAQLTSYEHKPADMLVPAPATGTDKATTLYITITDPTNKTAFDRGSDRKPLVAAAVRHKVKLGTHKKALLEAGDQGHPFTKGSLVFETAGAMREETQKWWKSIVEMEADQRIPGAPQSRREQGLEHTRSANKFSSYWLQAFSMPHARMQAESIAQWIGIFQKA